MTSPIQSPSRPTPFAGHVRRLVYDLRTEGSGPGRDAASIGVGVFVGCSPFYGFHLIICWVFGRLLRLNRLKMYLAANVSNPLMAPLIVFLELQAGAWIRRGSFHALTLEAVRATDPWTFGADLLLGSLIVGGVIGALAALATWAATRAGKADLGFTELARRASDRYVAISITAWEFARGKLRRDPVYRTVVTGGVLPSGGTLIDVGCGQGLTLAALAEARRLWVEGVWPSAVPAPPIFDRLVGIELRPGVASIASRALDGDATIVRADVRETSPERCRTVLMFDVLHMIPADDQLQLISAFAGALEPGGVVLVREADAAGGWRFEAVRTGNRLKAIAFGNWKQRFHFRSAREWEACFERLGFLIERRATHEGTPFANLLFVLRIRP
jgi:uncharacterized protein (DUF2062 family)